jgi:hypothetical protein
MHRQPLDAVILGLRSMLGGPVVPVLEGVIEPPNPDSVDRCVSPSLLSRRVVCGCVVWGAVRNIGGRVVLVWEGAFTGHSSRSVASLTCQCVYVMSAIVCVLACVYRALESQCCMRSHVNALV